MWRCNIFKQLPVGNSLVHRATGQNIQESMNLTVKKYYKEHLLRRMSEIVAEQNQKKMEGGFLSQLEVEKKQMADQIDNIRAEYEQKSAMIEQQLAQINIDLQNT